MSLSREEKEQLAARAQSLEERLTYSEGDVEPAVTEPIGEIIDTWCQNVADGDREQFRRRLELDGVTEEELPDLLATCGYPESEPLPAWVDLLDDLQTYLETEVPNRGTTLDELGVDVEDETDVPPFEHLLAPIAEFAIGRLDDATESDRVSETAVSTAASGLVSRLVKVCGHSLFIAFKSQIRDESEPGDEDDPSSRVGYWAFVERNLDDGLESFLLEFPVLAKWTATVVDQWVAMFEEFVDRLERDWERLERTFSEDGGFERVVEVETHGDVHHGGRQVLGITFACGTTVAYKPRSLGPEARYYDFLSWVNAESSLPDFRIVDCIAKDGYGWMEWVDPADCSDLDAVARYYERAGALICILYVLRFSDGNIENIIAEGDQPVVLDLETLLQPSLPDEHVFGDPDFQRIIDDSILATSMVPTRNSDDDVGHLNGIDKPRGKQSNISPRTFTHVNTDAMELEYEDVHYFEGESLARIDGETFDPREYAEEIIDGFRRTYDFFLENRERILDDDGPLELFADLETRFLYRNSTVYAKARRPLRTSAYLRSGLTASVRLEVLAKWIDWDDVKEELWEVYRTEHDVMWQLDIPRFTLNSSRTDLYLEDLTVESELDAPPLEHVRRRIRNMDTEDRERQVDYLVTAYDHERILNPKPPVEGSVPDTVPEWETVAERECDRIVESIRDEATRKPDGRLVWYQRVNRDESVYVRSLRDDIYDGRLGIGFFAAAMAKVYDRDDCRRLAAEAAAPLLEKLDDGPEAFAPKFGAGHGLSSLVYGFTKMGRWLDEPEYIRAATEISSFITPERLADNEILDIIGGTAGAIPGLLTLYDETGDEQLLDRATTVGEILLDRRIDVDGVPAWRTYGGEEQALNGPAHGIAGIAYALYRLGDAVEQPRFQEAAIESLQFEEDHYSPGEQNWPDFRFEMCRSGWCAGRSGIGLTRLAMHEMAEHDVLKRDFERALEGLEPETLMTEDDPCCGNFSKVEFLMRAAESLGEDEYRRQAERLAAGVVDRADELGGYSVGWQTDFSYSTSLFLGEMGIGYSLLRLAGADLPCLLLWE